MNQYGESDLVNNPRYQGQSGGTNVQGPEGESRYGAMPMSTGAGNPRADPLEPIRNPAAYGFRKDGPEGFRPPGMSEVGAQQQNLVQPNAHPSQAGYGSSQLGYGQHQELRPNNQSQNPLREDFAKEQPGYRQPGFGVPSQGQNTASLWPTPTAPANAHRSDLVGQGYGAPREGMVGRTDAMGVGSNSGAQGYDNYGNPRQEGVVDRAKDAMGVGPNSGYNDTRRDESGYGTQDYGQPREGMVDRAKDSMGVGPNSGYDNVRRVEPGFGTQGYGQPREGMVDRAKDAVGVGPNSGYANRRDQPGYDNYGNPQREGVVDRMKDKVGMGPNSGRPYDASQEYNPNVNHPSGETGFGGGMGQPQGVNTGYDQSRNLGTGYDNRMAIGADAYGQPRREGMVDRVKDDIGVGPNSGYDDRTRTGMDAYVHGNHPAGMQDRITGVNDPINEQTGNMNLPRGQHVPESVLGERRTEPGYDMSTGRLSDKIGGHHTSPGTGLGRDTDYDETRGKGYDDTAGGYDTKTGTGVDNDDGTNTGTGIDNYDATNTGTETGYDDAGVQQGTGAAPPKKGIMTKIKEKLHHTH